jgi:hypothetical protein
MLLSRPIRGSVQIEYTCHRCPSSRPFNASIVRILVDKGAPTRTMNNTRKETLEIARGIVDENYSVDSACDSNSSVVTPQNPIC